jgi:hypothetical protein
VDGHRGGHRLWLLSAGELSLAGSFVPLFPCSQNGHFSRSRGMWWSGSWGSGLIMPSGNGDKGNKGTGEQVKPRDGPLDLTREAGLHTPTPQEWAGKSSTTEKMWMARVAATDSGRCYSGSFVPLFTCSRVHRFTNWSLLAFKGHAAERLVAPPACHGVGEW